MIVKTYSTARERDRAYGLRSPHPYDPAGNYVVKAVARGPRPRTEGIYLHHAASGVRYERGDRVRAVDAAHSIAAHHMGSKARKGRGWRAPGYNAVLTLGPDGPELAWLQHWDAIGAHSQGENSIGFGLCIFGNFSKEKMPPELEQATLHVLRALCKWYKLPASAILGHREAPGASTECPGSSINMDALRSMVYGAKGNA